MELNYDSMQSEENKMKIKDTYFYKTFFSLAGIMALQNLIVFSVNLADNIMLGRFSEVAMSGVSLANQIQFLLQMLVNGAANGVAQTADRTHPQGVFRRFSARVGIEFAVGGGRDRISATGVVFAVG